MEDRFYLVGNNHNTVKGIRHELFIKTIGDIPIYEIIEIINNDGIINFFKVNKAETIIDIIGYYIDTTIRKKYNNISD